MKPGSQNARLLQVLSDGEWHLSRELHERAGYMRTNSRVAELRSYGHTILGEHVPHKTGTDGYRYRLLSKREAGSVRDRAAAPVHGGARSQATAMSLAASRSESSPTSVPLSAPGSARTESDVSRSTGPLQAVPRAPIAEPTQLALEVVS